MRITHESCETENASRQIYALNKSPSNPICSSKRAPRSALNNMISQCFYSYLKPTGRFAGRPAQSLTVRQLSYALYD